jgi:arginase
LGLIGVPTSAGAFAPGQEQAPRALREAGLVESLDLAGVVVRDHEDRQAWRWRPDRENRRAQNLPTVVEIVRETARRVAEAVRADEATLVLGGDCTVGIGTVAGHLASGERIGLIYFDTHADLNVPSSVREGALDWMGLAHMLGEEGAAPELVNVAPRAPLLQADQVILFAWGSEQATPFERAVIGGRDISVIPVDEVAAGPERAARRGRELIEDRCDRLLVHFDVDVIDFTDVPLSENWGRNEGLAFDDAMSALQTLLASPRLAGMTITELNPDHTEQDAHSIERFAAAISGSLASAPAIKHSERSAIDELLEEQSRVRGKKERK